VSAWAALQVKPQRLKFEVAEGMNIIEIESIATLTSKTPEGVPTSK
jgi:hypothetical protein